MTKTKWICDECGSDRVLVEMSVMVDPNQEDQEGHWMALYQDRQMVDYAYCDACAEAGRDGETVALEVPVR
jgi:hypothetical protein